jgi:hypothetical protein
MVEIMAGANQRDNYGTIIFRDNRAAWLGETGLPL